MTDKSTDTKLNSFIKRCIKHAREEDVNYHVIDCIDPIIRRCVDKDDPVSRLDHYLSDDQVPDEIHLDDEYRDNYYRFTLIIKAVGSLDEYAFVSELNEYMKWLKLQQIQPCYADVCFTETNSVTIDKDGKCVPISTSKPVYVSTVVRNSNYDEVSPPRSPSSTLAFSPLSSPLPSPLKTSLASKPQVIEQNKSLINIPAVDKPTERLTPKSKRGKKSVCDLYNDDDKKFNNNLVLKSKNPTPNNSPTTSRNSQILNNNSIPIDNPIPNKNAISNIGSPPKEDNILKDNTIKTLLTNDHLLTDDFHSKEEKTLIHIASVIASLRGIDLDEKVYKFRSLDALKASTLYKKLGDTPEYKRERLVTSYFPLLEKMHEEIHKDIIDRITNGYKHLTDLSAAIFEYESHLRDLMMMHGLTTLARSLAIGSKTSVLLDPDVGPKKRVPKLVREPILHPNVSIKSIKEIKELVDEADIDPFDEPPNEGYIPYTKILVCCQLLRDRTADILLHLDNIKRIMDVKYHNMGRDKGNIVLRCTKQYNKNKELLDYSKMRFDYLLEHYKLLREYGCEARFNSTVVEEKVKELYKAIENHKETKTIYDLYAVGHAKTNVGLYGRYREVYNKFTESLIDVKEYLNKSSIELTEQLPKCLDDIQVGDIVLPRLIRIVEKGISKGKVVNNPDAIKIKHIKTSRRYKTIGQIVDDFDVNATREAATLRIEVDGMKSSDIVVNVSRKLINIADGRMTTAAELRKLSQLLFLAVGEDKVSEDDNMNRIVENNTGIMDRLMDVETDDKNVVINDKKGKNEILSDNNVDESMDIVS